jgi:hypothetical protein
VVSRARPSVLEPLPCVAERDSTSHTSTVPHSLRGVDPIIMQDSFEIPGIPMPDPASRTVAAARQFYDTAAANVAIGLRSWAVLRPI